MSAPAAVTLRRQGAPDLLIAYADAVAALPIGPDGRRIRRNAAARLLAAHPQLAAWMRRPTPARLADLKRTGAWPFLTWCFVEGHLEPDLDLLLAKTPGDLYLQWAARHPGDVQQITEVAQRFGWSANWTRDVTRGALALVCLTAGKTLAELDDDDFGAFAGALAEAPTAARDAWMHNSARVFSLHQACYELRICRHPPRQARPGQATIAQRVQAISQPGIRAAALRYLTTVAATLRPNTVGLRTDSLIVFSEYLAAAHPDVRSLTSSPASTSRDSWLTTISGPGAAASPATRPSPRRSASGPSSTCAASSPTWRCGAGPSGRPGGCCSPLTSPGWRSRCLALSRRMPTGT